MLKYVLFLFGAVCTLGPLMGSTATFVVWAIVQFIQAVSSKTAKEEIKRHNK